jgi:Tfp pilus assembly protein PilN
MQSIPTWIQTLIAALVLGGGLVTSHTNTSNRITVLEVQQAQLEKGHDDVVEALEDNTKELHRLNEALIRQEKD